MAKQVICLTENIDSWSEPENKLQAVIETLKPYYGKEVIVWGGGGYSGSKAILDHVELHPTILRDHAGYTLQAHLKNTTPPMCGHSDFTPWLGSWQLSVCK